MRGSVQKVRIAVAMPRAANEKYPPILVVVKFVIAAPRASSIKAKSVAVASIPVSTTSVYYGHGTRTKGR